jgi:hypothetical protein
VSNLAAVSFVSDTDFDTFVTQEVKACDRRCGNESLTQDTSGEMRQHAWPFGHGASGGASGETFGIDEALGGRGAASLPSVLAPRPKKGITCQRS